MEVVLDLSHISFGYKEKIRKDFSLNICGGDKVLLKGLNGSGKTSLIRTICGLMPVHDGAVVLNNTALTNKNHLSVVTEHCSVLLTQPLLAQGISVREYLELHKDNLDTDRLNEAIDLFELTQLLNSKLGSISDGERQKVLLAKTLSKKAVLYILDEPTTYLDYKATANLYHYLKSSDYTLLMASHDIESVEPWMDKVVQL